MSLALHPSPKSEDGCSADLASLVNLIRNGSTDAVSDLYQQLIPGMKMFLKRRIGMEYEDALQESFLSLLSSIQSGALQNPYGLRAYLVTIMSRTCKIAYRNPMQYPLIHNHPRVSCLGTVNQLNTAIERQAKLQFMAEALDRMPVLMRLVIEKSYLEEKPKEVVMAELELTPTQFRLTKSRAKLRLAKELQRILSLQSLNKSLAGEQNKRTHDLSRIV